MFVGLAGGIRFLGVTYDSARAVVGLVTQHSDTLQRHRIGPSGTRPTLQAEVYSTRRDAQRWANRRRRRGEGWQPPERPALSLDDAASRSWDTVGDVEAVDRLSGPVGWVIDPVGIQEVPVGGDNKIPAVVSGPGSKRTRRSGGSSPQSWPRPRRGRGGRPHRSRTPWRAEIVHKPGR